MIHEHCNTLLIKACLITKDWENLLIFFSWSLGILSHFISKKISYFQDFVFQKFELQEFVFQEFVFQEFVMAPPELKGDIKGTVSVILTKPSCKDENSPIHKSTL